MDEAFFTNLSLDIIFNILYRLPIKTIIICKCVCKSWLEMLESPEFIKYHLSMSIPGLIISQDRGCVQEPVHPDEHHLKFKIWEFVDKLKLEDHELRYNLVTEFSRGRLGSPFRNQILMHDSVNGLLLLSRERSKPYYPYVCNPITREYIELQDPEMARSSSRGTYGFGVSKTSGQYKVVRILHNSDCKVYTLGTGSWRSVALDGSSYHYSYRLNGAFFNGNLHWLVKDMSGSLSISCFDLETELFNIFSGPLLPGKRSFEIKLVVLSEDYLHLCCNTRDKIVIFVMKEYGVNRSWTQDIIIEKDIFIIHHDFLFVYPIKIFKNGDILMCWNDLDNMFCYYSKQTKSLKKFRSLFPPRYNSGVSLHVSSFISLKWFAMETVSKL